MMQRHIILSLVLLMLCPGFLRAQERELKGKVVRMGAQNEEIPEENVTIRIEATGISKNTNTYGEFQPPLPDPYKAGETVPLMVDKPGWCILDPLDGEARIPPNLHTALVQVHLVPMGTVSDSQHLKELLEKWLQEREISQQPVRPDGKIEKTDSWNYVVKKARKCDIDLKIMREIFDELVENQNDPCKLALVASKKGDFRGASTLFQKCADKEQDKRKKVIALRRAGDSHIDADEFNEALKSTIVL